MPGGEIDWKQVAVLLVAGLIGVISSVQASDSLVAYPNAVFDNTAEFNDADSFRVRFVRDGKNVTEVIRLYYVDSPEATYGSDSDLRRIREQARYFGLEDERRKVVVEYGEKARAWVRKKLAQPFTVYTAGARAMGRSRKPRIYAMVETADGEDNPLDLNAASAEELQQLKGIGPELANRIIAAKPFKRVDEIVEVPGIGPATLEKIGRFRTVNPAAP